MTLDIRTFAFNGVLATHSVRDMQSTGILRTRPSQAESEEANLLAPVASSIWSGSTEMRRHYRILFVFENVVRDFINSRLLELFGVNWFEDRCTTSMKKKVETRRAGEKANRWHGGIHRDAIYYLDFGDLSKLLTNNWSSFEEFFPSQLWVQSRLEDAERSRNVIAHTNLLKSEDGERLKMHLGDWLRQVG